MKNSFIYTCILFAVFSITVIGCKNNSANNSSEDQNLKNKEKAKTTSMEFKSKFHDFGEVEQGEIISYTYKFKNTGDNDLIINRATASCGCTVPKWTKEPIAPGDSGMLEATFNTHGRRGKQVKTITVYANIPDGARKISFTANISSPDDE